MYGWNSYYANSPQTPSRQPQSSLLTPVTPTAGNITPGAFASGSGASQPFIYNSYMCGAGVTPVYSNGSPSSLVILPGLSPSKTVNFPVHQSNSVPYERYHQLNKLYQTIQLKKYATSAIDPVRNYLTVYEYNINNQWIIWDYETGFVHLTGLWKAADNGNTTNHRCKADIVKLLDSTPKQYHNYIKRIRGGFLKIQGTWLPYSLCKILARRFCYHIRYELIPIFGSDFPNYCLPPDDARFGELKFDDTEIQMDDRKRKRDRKFDVMEASKCLHSLKSPSDSTANSYFEIPRQPVYKLEPLDTSLDRSYFARPMQNPPELMSPVSFTHQRSSSDSSVTGASNYIAMPQGDGIQSLLLAADITDKPAGDPSPKARRVSIKINDLLS